MPQTELDKAVMEKFQPYVEAVGRVAHTWNQLQESLGQIFADLMGGGHATALAAWYAAASDRGRHLMLKAVIDAAEASSCWKQHATAKADVAWLVKKTMDLAEERNMAVHAPMGVTADSGAIEIVPAYFYGNPLAEKFLQRGRGVMRELERCEDWTTALHNFADLAKDALRYKQRTWPQRPVRPNDEPKAAPNT
jgi:hypothetical protein